MILFQIYQVHYDNCERSYQKFFIKLFSRNVNFQTNLIRSKLLQRAASDFKS